MSLQRGGSGGRVGGRTIDDVIVAALVGVADLVGQLQGPRGLDLGAGSGGLGVVGDAALLPAEVEDAGGGGGGEEEDGGELHFVFVWIVLVLVRVCSLEC